MATLKRNVLFGVLVCFVLASAGSLSASLQHPNLERGFQPEKSYRANDIDHVNLFNGNLMVNIPIGMNYPVAGGFDYQFRLIYNSKLWDIYEVCPPPPGDCFGRSEALRTNNAGFGWSVTLGDLYPPNSPPQNPESKWMYLSADGAEHLFENKLHAGDPVHSGVFYSRDGSYLRMKVSGNTRKIEYPNGDVHTFGPVAAFGGDLKLLEIRDAFGNGLDITYLSRTWWDVTDTVGRSHKLFFGLYTVDGETQPILERINFAAFDGSRADWRLNYESLPVERPCPFEDPVWSPTATVPLLSSINMPGGAQYDLPAASSYQLTKSGFGIASCRATGTLRRIRLPTMASIGWQHGTYVFPTGEATPGTPIPPRLLNRLPGVIGRTAYYENGAVEGTWTYDSNLVSEGAGVEPVEMTNTVTNPLGHRTVNYFSAYIGGNNSYPAAQVDHYGLAYSPKRPNAGGRFLSREIFQGGVRKRSISVKYDDDVAGNSGAVGDPKQINQRLASERTVYRDDGNRWTSVDFSDFDGLGNYRRQTTQGNFDPVEANERIRYTRFNPNNGTFPGSFTLPGPNQPWILGTWDVAWQQEDGWRAEQRACFEASTGYLLRQRALLQSGSLSAHDVLQVFGRNAQGNTFIERHYGGDLQNLSTAANLCTSGLPASPWMRVDHTYEHGQLATSKVFGTTFFQVDRTIDQNTGLPSSSRDTAELETAYDYDTLGRLRWLMPQAGHGSWTQWVYLRATSPTSLAQVRVHHRGNGSRSAPILAREQYAFDGMGRMWREQRLLPGGWASRVTRYNPLGWPTRVSAWASSPSQWTQYLDYDAFGRVGRIVPPEGASHEVRFSYFGNRRMTRKSKIGTHSNGSGGVAETDFTTAEIYDRQGRLFKVVEPAGGLTAEYRYDAGDRLIQSRLLGPNPQVRTFVYDRRGFLTRETHPESGQRRYLNLDFLGQPHRELTAAGRDLNFTYDAAQRLTLVEDRSSGDPLLEYVYATSNGTGNRRKGKLERAVSHSHINIPWAPTAEVDIRVEETYKYGGRDGRVSQRDTVVTDSVLESGVSRTFTQSWVYDPLGNVQRTVYPRCTHGACSSTAGPSRQVNYGYTYGRLTSVSGAVNSISYHANGLPHRIVRANGTTDVITTDPAGHPRPYTFDLEGSFGTLGLGEHLYDGSGNLKQVGLGSGNTYFYDGVGRLKRFGFASGQWREYDYDPYGNMTRLRHFDGTSTTTRTFGVNTSTNRLSAAAYDADGHLTAWGGESFDWDALGRMKHYEFPNEVYAYTVDGERILTLRWDGQQAEETWTLRDLDGKVLTVYEQIGNNQVGDWQWKKDYLYRGRQQVMMASDEAWPNHQKYFSLDHLGTPRVITNAAGNIDEVRHYFGFGEEMVSTSTDDTKRFTGHERDFHALGSADDLDYMHARYYKPHLSRFLSVDPDPQSVALQNPQSWNKFSYVLNSPLVYTDPNGEKWFRTDEGWAYFEGVDFIEEIVVRADGTTSTTTVAGLDSFVTFDGGNLTLFQADGSTESFMARAGVLDAEGNTRADQQDVVDVGPIPEGEWYFDPRKVQNFSSTSRFDRFKGMIGRGTWRGGVDSWGRHRVWLYPEPATDTKGRDGFTIHGGAEFGSRGCIDLCRSDSGFFRAIDRTLDKIPVYVDYPDN